MKKDQVIADRYRLVERLGDGGMGVVWEGYDERLRRKVAVKLVKVPGDLGAPQGQEMVRRTMREGRIAARLHHPQLITVYDVVEDGGRPYLIMEYMASRSLADVLTERDKLPTAEVAAIGAQAAAGLAAAHAGDVVHRDVKPGNLLVGDDGTVKMTDFGISRVVADLTGTLTGTFAGTPAYLAPEVAKGEQATFAADVYSLGATLYQAVEGMPPAGNESNPMKMLYRVSSGEVTQPTQAGPLTTVLMSMLAADPKQRPSMAEAAETLDALQNGDTPPPAPAAAPTAVIPAPTPPPATPRLDPLPVPTAAVPAVARTQDSPDNSANNRRKAILLAIGLVVVAVVAAGVTFLVNDKDQPADNQADQPPASQTQQTQSSEPPPSNEPTTTTKATTTTTTTQTSATSPPAPPGAATPVEAVTSYYSLMPGNRDASWTRLSAKYQVSPSGGRDGYDRFWNKVTSVTASGVTSVGASSVQASVLYVFTDGRRVQERHQYNLINQNGQWLIDTSSVLSSNPA